MDSMDIRYFCPSYKRTEKSISQINYPFFKIVVMEAEAEAYKANGNDIVVCPDRVQGNVCRVRNWILRENADADCVVIMDDDCSYIGKYLEQSQVRLSPDDLEEMCEMATIMAYDMDVKMWGLNCVVDKMAYREATPFSFTSYVGSPFTAHCKTDIFFDEGLPLKEDYDITLQHLNRHRRVLRLNQYHYDVKQSKQAGGCATYRNMDEEKRQFRLLQKKWGSKIITEDKTSRKSFDYNPIMHVPIKGV